MGVEIAITVAREETRVAVLDNGVVTDLFGDRAKHKDFVGNIYKGKVAKVLPGMQAAFHPAGHILGAASVELALDGAQPRRLLVSGDLGRPDHPVLVGPAAPPEADAVLVESTYGDRRHAAPEEAEQQLAAVVSRTAARGSRSTA